MNNKHFGVLALALAGTLAAGAAQAGRSADVQWSVTLGNPGVSVSLGSPYYGQPVYAPRVYAQPIYAQPIYAQPVYGSRYQQPVVVVPRRGVQGRGWRDADRDGIPNRYDRNHSPRWDVDGDGIPNRYDRSRGDRDGDGIPDRRNPRPYGR